MTVLRFPITNGKWDMRFARMQSEEYTQSYGDFKSRTPIQRLPLLFRICVWLVRTSQAETLYQLIVPVAKEGPCLRPILHFM